MIPPCLSRAIVLVAVGLALSSTAVIAQREDSARRSLTELSADVVRATQAYRDAVARSLPIHEATLRETVAAVEERRRLHAAGALSRADVDEAEHALAAAQRERQEAQEALDEADRLLFEAALQQRLAGLTPLPRGGYQDTVMLVRFNGAAAWSLGQVPALDRRFLEAFGRRLPISAFGQTRMHDRLGLDHRTAIDVALHPDSAEGRWLMQHLRGAGIPFIGVRGVVPGASTGAHIHIGSESARVIAR
jgi:hypothetical protein